MTPKEQADCFQRWLDNHFGLIVKIVRGHVDLPQDQEDLLQEILLKLWASIPRFRGESNETTWIFRVAFNATMTWKRIEGRRTANHSTYLNQVFHQSPTALIAKPDSHELVEQLLSLIRTLPQIDASLALMYLEGLSYGDMAEVLGISETNVGARLSRIRKQLAAKVRVDP